MQSVALQSPFCTEAMHRSLAPCHQHGHFILLHAAASSLNLDVIRRRTDVIRWRLYANNLSSWRPQFYQHLISGAGAASEIELVLKSHLIILIYSHISLLVYLPPQTILIQSRNVLPCSRTSIFQIASSWFFLKMCSEKWYRIDRSGYDDVSLDFFASQFVAVLCTYLYHLADLCKNRI